MLPSHPAKVQSVEQMTALLNSFTTSMLSLASATTKRETAERSYTEQKNLLSKNETQFGGYTALRDYRQKEVKVLERHFKDTDEKLNTAKQAHTTLTAAFATMVSASQVAPPAPPPAANDKHAELRAELELCQQAMAALQTQMAQVQQDQIGLKADHESKIDGIKIELSDAKRNLPAADELRAWNSYRPEIDKLEGWTKDLQRDFHDALDAIIERLDTLEKDLTELRTQSASQPLSRLPNAETEETKANFTNLSRQLDDQRCALDLVKIEVKNIESLQSATHQLKTRQDALGTTVKSIETAVKELNHDIFSSRTLPSSKEAEQDVKCLADCVADIEETLDKTNQGFVQLQDHYNTIATEVANVTSILAQGKDFAPDPSNHTTLENAQSNRPVSFDAEEKRQLVEFRTRLSSLEKLKNQNDPRHQQSDNHHDRISTLEKWAVQLKSRVHTLTVRADTLSTITQSLQQRYDNLTTEEMMRSVVNQIGTLYPAYQTNYGHMGTRVDNIERNVGGVKDASSMALDIAKEALAKADTRHTQLMKIETTVDEVTRQQERVDTELQHLKNAHGHSEAQRLSQVGRDQELTERVLKVEGEVEELKGDVKGVGEDIEYLAQTHGESKDAALKLQCAVDLFNKVSGQKEIDWTVGVKES